MAPKRKHSIPRLFKSANNIPAENFTRKKHALGKIFELIPMGMLITDQDGKIEIVNKKIEKIFGYKGNELIGKPVETLIPERFRKTHIGQRSQYKNGVKERPMGSGRHLIGMKKNGLEIPVEIGLSKIQDPDGDKFVASISDITKLTRLHTKLAEEHERAVVTLNSIGDGVITTDIDGVIDMINPMAEKLCGWSNLKATGKHISEVFKVIHEVTREKVPDPIVECLTSNKVVERKFETILINKNRMEIPIEDNAAPIHNSDGQIIGAVLVFHDMTQSRADAREIKYQANHDVLTGLLNRRQFDHRLKVSLGQEQNGKSKNVLLFIDLDHFKRVNDAVGHAAGDELLRQVTSLLASKLRQRDTFARLGGDEFGILLEHATQKIGIKIAHKLRDALAEFRFYWKGQVFGIGISIGITTSANRHKSADELLSEADAACYAAKKSGRNRVQLYDHTAAKLRSETSIANLLENALTNNRILLYQQRIMANNDDQNFLYYEILMRLQTEQGDILQPGQFLPAAERFGFAGSIDRWVTRAVFDWLSQHHDKSPVPTILSINLSAQSITDFSFKDYVRGLMNEFEILDGSICFEINETAIMKNIENAILFIQELRRLGFKISLDNFGSGQTSYAHLKELPVDFLKIDGNYVKNIAIDPINFSIVKSINDVGHVMKIKTVAEFAENDAIIKKLKQIGVDFLQGFGISNPAPIEELLTENKQESVVKAKAL